MLRHYRLLHTRFPRPIPAQASAYQHHTDTHPSHYQCHQTSDDTDSAKDVYRYDAGTQRLERVSVGENGYEANGNGEACTGSACDAIIGANEERSVVYSGQDLNS